MVVEERLKSAKRFVNWFIGTQMRFSPSDPRYAQVYSDAMLGLLRAARTYDPEASAWSTYAVKCMRYAVLRTLKDERRLKRKHERHVELSDPVEGPEEDACVRDVLVDPDADGPEDAAVNTELKTRVAYVLATLTAREEWVLRYRLGLGSRVEETQDNIGIEMGISGCRVAQIEHKAYRKLRHRSRNRYLRAFIDPNYG